MHLKDLVGYDLGSRNLEYDERDAILYALAVGAPADDLQLVYERDLQVLPGYACALGLWAVEAAGNLGAYDRTQSLHASQSLVMHTPMPTTGPIRSNASVQAVWDKGRATVVDIEVASEVFTANYTIFLPGIGDWGGERGPASEPPVELEPSWSTAFRTSTNLAALYRLTGDRHPIHIDPETAKSNNFERPILHGLCTLGIVARACAEAVNARPTALQSLSAKLAAPVFPGDQMTISAGKTSSGELVFSASAGGTEVLKNGRACFT